MRTDISKYLFHGVRKPNLKDYPEQFDDSVYKYLDNPEYLSEFDILKNIIIEGVVKASLSYRNGNPTVYGGEPVVCFTEMPLLNVIQYEKKHHKKPKISTYGLAVLKKDFYSNGGRPVISGLSIEIPINNNRIFCNSILPLHEQYRYVSLNLNTSNKIDWTHEREWRIKCDEYISIKNNYIDDYYNCKGLNIFDEDRFKECVIVVKTIEEADELSKIVDHQLDLNYSYGNTEFSTKIKFLILENAIKAMNENSLITSIEKLPKDAFYTYKYEKLNEIEIAHIVNTIDECKKLAIKFANEYIIENKDSLIDSSGFRDICGYANVKSYKPRNKFVYYLIENKFMYASSNGSYVFENLVVNIPMYQGLTYHEYISRKQCEYLNEKIGNFFIMDSWLD